MDFAQQQRNPARHLIGIGGVVLFHVIIVYALVTGLARKVVEVVKGPIEVKVIEEAIKKPPPPPDAAPPPPKLAAPPPPFIPPPEVNIAPPPAPPPAIAAITQEAPPAPQAPVIQPAPAPAPTPAPTVRAASVVCPNYREVMQSIPYPREALQDNIEGDVTVEFTVTGEGKIRDPIIRSSSNRVFNRVSLNVVQTRLTCQGQGQDVRVQAPLRFTIK
jgi:protein TonB